MQPLFKRRSITWQTVIKILISTALLGYLLYKAQLNAIGSVIAYADVKYYILSVALYIVIQPIRTLRWGMLLQIKNITVSQVKLLFLCFIGTFFSSFLPTIVGGDMVRGYYLFRESDSHENSFASIIVERLCGLLVIIGIGCASSIYFFIAAGPSLLITISLVGCFIMLFTLTLILNQPMCAKLYRPLRTLRRWRIIQSMKDICQATLSYKAHPLALTGCVALSLLYEFIIIYIYYLLSVSLAWHIPFKVCILAVPVITIVSMLPISFGGLGIREGATVLFFSGYGIAAASAISLSLLSYSIALVAGIIGGILYPFYAKSMIKSNSG